MRTSTTLLTSAGIALAAVLTAPRSAQAQAAAAPSTAAAPAPAPECRLAIDPSAIKVGPAAVVVQAAHSEAVGDSLSASVPAESGLQVTGVEKGTSAMVVRVTFNTNAAKAGEYILTLKGEKATCTGKVTVTTN